MSPVNDQFIPFGFAFVFGDDASHFYGIGQLQLAAGKLPIAVQIGRVDGRHFGLLFDIDDRQYRGGSFPAHRFPREKGKSDGLGSVDLTAGGYMVGKFAFGLSAFPLPDTEALSVERGTVGLCFRRFLRRKMARSCNPFDSVASSLFQFLIPVTFVVFAHASICARLRRRSRPVRPKTHNLLSATAMAFAVCWAPLNIFNLLNDFLSFLSDYQQVKLTVYAVCHLAGMSSACINPVLYGWFNKNLRKY